MQAIVVNSWVKSYDDMRVSQVAIPRPQSDELLIHIKASGLNFADLLYARGKHQNNRSLVTPPFILGQEYAGIVVSAPPSSLFSVGDRVFGGGQGAFASVIAAKPSALHKIPDQWSFADAAGLAATAPVSYGALITRAELAKGEIVLIHAAAGGLGLMAIQIAKAVGARVIATAGSDEKLAVARRFGADICINYTNDAEWWKAVMRATDQVGVDVVYDSVGLVGSSLKCLKHNGRILVIGFAGTEGNIEKIAMNRVLLKQAQIIGYRYGESGRRFPHETQEIWDGVMALIEAGLLRPTVFDRKYSGLSQVPSAMNDLAARKTWGKCVITLDDDQTRPVL